ncbi:MAG: hypothetical protein NXI24_06265 [bacterium]|nr:hypothetical protein [bacterium]
MTPSPEQHADAETTAAQSRRVFAWLQRRSDWRRWWQIPLLLAVLYAPAFAMGQVMDDYHFATAFRRDSTLSIDMLLNSFNFGERKDENGKRYRNLPWWSAPDFSMRFLRPAAAFSLWLDYHLLSLPLRHLHSLLWYGFLLWGLAGFYRRALRFWNSHDAARRPAANSGGDSSSDAQAQTGATPEKIAFLALLLFAVNDAHALPVAWVAHRSLLIAVGFAVWSLRYFEAYLQGESPWWIGPLFFICALSGGEAALGILAYAGLRVFFAPGLQSGKSAAAGESLIPRASFGETLRRALPLLPYGIIALVYLALYSAGGFGTFESGLYLNPLREPLAFLAQFVQSWPILMGALLGPISAGFYGLREAIPGIVWWFLVPAGLVVIALNLYYLRPFRDRTGALLFGGAMLALIPASMAAPADRLLMMAGIGAYPLIARFLLERRGWFWWALLIGHLFLSALNVPGTTQFFADYGAFAREKITDLQAATPPNTPADRKLVLLNAPGICLGLQFRHLYGAHFGELDADNFVMAANNMSATKVKRIDARTIEIETKYPGRSGARVFRRANRHIQIGQPVIKKNFATVRVLTMDSEGWPSRIRMRFDAPLSEIAFIAFHEDEYRYIEFPAAGEVLTIPAPADADRKLYL